MKKNNKSQTESKQILSREISQEMKESYIDYAMSVIVARALPDVRDGLKPVHRRILYTMHEEGLTHSAKFRKSATVVGATLGKYHPHGDIAVYDALVRMAQDFSMRYPLINGQGNFGCFTRDTKVRLCDGRSLNFGNLIKEQSEGKRHWTFTFNHQTREIEITEIKNPRLTRKKEKIMEVTLDNRAKIKCTLDHRFMLRVGSYKEAKELKAGDSLMPLYIKLYDGKNDLSLKRHERERYNNFIPRIENALNYFHNFSEIVEKAQSYNHKVVATRILRKREDVYDLTVEPWHNFALAASVFVHNSLDNDPPAASRYTECRMAALSDEMLKDISKDTVDFVDNYDSTRKEPKVLPSPLPQLLLNGSLGIAVGMATNIPPHNLGEVCDAAIYLIDHPDATTEDLFEFVKGPDFPTGGMIFNFKEVISAYSQGKGPILARGKAEVVEKKNGWQIIITEIPYQVQKSGLVSQIAKLVQDKRIEKIRDVRDESDREGLRIVLELRKGAFPQKVLNVLYRYTDLQKKFHLNLLALVDGIQPKILSLSDVLTYYIEHRREVVLRRSKYELAKARAREHILIGLTKCLSEIDKVIATIKKSKTREDAKKNLMSKFRLTQIQAEAILETKLSALARLERKKLEDELKQIRATIKELAAVIKSPKRIKAVVKKELKEVKEKYQDPRRTRVYHKKPEAITDEDIIPEEDTIITLTQKCYIKRLDPAIYKIQKRGGKGIIGAETKDEDLVEHFVLANTHDQLLVFTDSGKVFGLPVYEIPKSTRTSRGRALVNFLEIGGEEKILAILPIGKRDIELGTRYLAMATKNGIVKKTALEKFKNLRSSGLIAINLRKNDILRTVRKTTGDDQLTLVTKNGLAIRFKEKEVRPMERNSRGLIGMRLKKSDEVIGMETMQGQKSKVKGQKSKEYLLVITENGYGKMTLVKQYRLQKRGGAGLKTARVTKKTGSLVKSKILKREEDLIIISKKGQVIRILAKNISVLGRTTQGVRIMRLAPGDKVASLVYL